MSAKAVRVRITGRVQGVFFRAWAKEKAEAFGVQGWIRNRLDGDVEALFIGEAAAVDRLLAACREGPPTAQVDEVKTEPAQGLAPAGFEIKPTV
ncbi:MAG TPA: acylphosphatase [Sphingomonadales bacterium]|nr:acylphosphatase [Sphingomonadales bacterium]